MSGFFRKLRLQYVERRLRNAENDWERLSFQRCPLNHDAMSDLKEAIAELRRRRLFLSASDRSVRP